MPKSLAGQGMWTEHRAEWKNEAGSNVGCSPPPSKHRPWPIPGDTPAIPQRSSTRRPPSTLAMAPPVVWQPVRVFPPASYQALPLPRKDQVVGPVAPPTVRLVCGTKLPGWPNVVQRALFTIHPRSVHGGPVGGPNFYAPRGPGPYGTSIVLCLAPQHPHPPPVLDPERFVEGLGPAGTSTTELCSTLRSGLTMAMDLCAVRNVLNPCSPPFAPCSAWPSP